MGLAGTQGPNDISLRRDYCSVPCKLIKEMPVDERKMELLLAIVRELAYEARAKYQPRREKPWKVLSGLEWTQRCLDADWEKDRPREEINWNEKK